jgi:hypothetical protein
MSDVPTLPSAFSHFAEIVDINPAN